MDNAVGISTPNRISTTAEQSNSVSSTTTSQHNLEYSLFCLFLVAHLSHTVVLARAAELTVIPGGIVVNVVGETLSFRLHLSFPRYEQPQEQNMQQDGTLSSNDERYLRKPNILD